MDIPGFAFTHAPIGLMISRYRLIVGCNVSFARMFGFTAEELTGSSVADLYPSAKEFVDIGSRWLREMKNSLQFEDQRIMMRCDGSLFWCQVVGRSVCPEDPFRECIWSFHDQSDFRLVSDLTIREREVAMLCVAGKTSKEIGLALGISHRTAEAHRARLMQKLGARSVTELIGKIVGLPA